MNHGIRRAILTAVTVLLPCCVMAPPPPGPAARRPAGWHERPAPPDLVKTKKGRYKVRSPWILVLHGRVWRVPAGYTTNGITAPARIRKMLGDGVDHPETWAAVFHDWLFTRPGVSRAEADRLFYDLLIAYRVPESKARLMHGTVAAYSASKRFR